MASNPSGAPICPFVAIPMLDQTELAFEKAQCGGTLDEAKQKAKAMLAENELRPVVIFQAVTMLGTVKKVDVIWSPKG